MAVLNDPVQLRALLGNYAEKAQTLEAEVEDMRPDCEAFASIAVSDGSMSLTDAAKVLQVPPKKLFSWLAENGWIYKRPNSSWIAYQEKIKQGLLEHKVTTIKRDDGTEKTVHQVKATPKGITKLSRLIGELMSVARQGIMR
ncbi:MAG: phage antirepressor KilAC domain-containing protein [Paraprevotella sp.]|nr:phage antirepressor KilAC domain-containing protein [Paraprevotella sp.]